MNNISIKFFLVLSALLILNSCSKDANTNPISNTYLAKSAQLGTWRVTKYENNGKDELALFSSFVFTFENGKVMATNATNSATGSYSTGTDDSKVQFILNFGTATPFDELNEDWDVIELNDNKISLKHLSGGNSEVDYLIIEKTSSIPTDPTNPNNPSNPINTTILSKIQSGIWEITLFDESGINNTTQFSNYIFKIYESKIVANSNGNVSAGTFILGKDNSTDKVVINFGTQSPLDELNEDWEVIEVTDSKISLKHVSGGNGGTDLLTLEKTTKTPSNPSNPTNPTNSTLIDNITNGQWTISNYTSKGKDETTNYSAYVFSFSNGQIKAVKNGTTAIGFYTVDKSNGVEEFILNFSSTIPLDELNEDWTIIENTTSKISLKHASGGNGGTDLLTFIKQ